MSNKDTAMQERCIYCGKEQYAMAVYSISYGKSECVWCGKIPPILTVEEYNKEIKKQQNKES